MTFLSMQSIKPSWSKWSLWLLDAFLTLLLVLMIGYNFWVMISTSNRQAQNETPKKFANVAVEEPMIRTLWKSIEQITSITLGFIPEIIAQSFRKIEPFEEIVRWGDIRHLWLDVWECHPTFPSSHIFHAYETLKKYHSCFARIYWCCESCMVLTVIFLLGHQHFCVCVVLWIYQGKQRSRLFKRFLDFHVQNHISCQIGLSYPWRIDMIVLSNYIWVKLGNKIIFELVFGPISMTRLKAQ